MAVVASLRSTALAQKATATTPAEQSFAHVSGKVETPGLDRLQPIAGVMVTVHRVGPDSSGALDSVVTDAQGKYSLRYQRFGAADGIYFAACVYRGIAYFSAPLKSTRASGDEGAITVFDTTSRTVEFQVRGHHVVVSAPRPDGVRDIVEVWELSNDTTLTVVGRDSVSAVWTAPLPTGATHFTGGQGDVSPDALAARGNRVVMLAAFGPGVKQLSYSYALPSSAFPLTLTAERATSVYEVLLEDPTAQITGGSLKPQPVATTQGRTFQRFLGQDVAKDASIRISVPVSTAAARRDVLVGLAVAIVLIMAGALWRALSGRGVRAPVRGVASPPDTESMLAALAMLDARHERADPTLGNAEYAAKRAQLKTQLGVALVAEGPPV